MQDKDKVSLAYARLRHAEDCLKSAKYLLDVGDYKSSANRSYYAAFHAMRAVLAFDEIDMKHHSGIISEFRKQYIKTGAFDAEFSKTISVLFDSRTNSDYDDFYIISKEDTEIQYDNAVQFWKAVRSFVYSKSIKE